MNRGHRELVGLQVTFSKGFPQYSLTHYYRWKVEGETPRIGMVWGYDMRRYEPIVKIMGSLQSAYAAAIISIWQQITHGCIREYYQFHVDCSPQRLGLEGQWSHWAER